MHNTKLVQLFQTLSKVEQNRLERFIDSPYHNRHSDVKALLDYLLAVSPPTLEGAHAAVFPNQPYNSTKLRNTQSYLLKLVEKFLVYEHLEQDEAAYCQLLLPLYRQRGLHKGFQSTVRNNARYLSKQPHRSVQYHYGEFCLQQEQFLHAQERNRLEDKNIQAVLDSFDIYYSTNKLRYAITALSHQNIFNVQYDLGSMETLLQRVEARNWLEIPSVAAYYHSYKMLTTPQTAEYAQLKQLIVEQWELFEPSELRDLYLTAINAFIRQLNRGEAGVLEELFLLYQSGLERGVFMVDGELSRFTYKNITSVAIRCAAYEWGANFVEEYAPHLPAEHRQNYRRYCQARLSYATEAYQEAMHCLQTLGSTDREVIMDGKGMLIKIYYMLGEYDALESLLSSFKTYLKRDQYISADLKAVYLNFVHYVQRLQQHNPYDPEARAQLSQDVLNERQLPERQWLLRQLEAG